MTTIKEIAKRANVSIGTVDRVIHKRGHVSKETEKKIKRIIEEFGYKPNLFAKHLKLSKTFTFGILMPKPFQDSMYWSLPIKGITKAQNELVGQRVEVKYFFYDKYSEASCNKAIKEMLKTNLDGLIIAPVLSKVFDKLIRLIPENLPYIFFDTFIPNANYISYIGQDSFQSGVLSAKLMRIVIKEKGTIAIIRVMPEDYHIEDRVDGFLTYCKKYPDIETKVYEIIGGNNIDVQYKTFKGIISNNKNLRGIFVPHAITHRIAEYIKSHKLSGKIHIIGYDMVEENIKYLRQGIIDFLISQQSEKQGYESIYSLYRHVVLREQVKKKFMMQIDIITKENIEYYSN